MSEARTIFGFVPQFWVINFVELLERAAFYGALSFAAVYLDSLSYSGAVLGVLLAMATTLPYLISVASGPFAEKYGYKPMTVIAFVGYALGYVVLAAFPTTAMIALGFLFVGLGSGLFKAIPAACITHLTPESKRNVGYVIYYWAINLGALLMPIILAYAILSPGGYDLGAYRNAFYAVGGMSAAAFGISLAFFRNPVEPQREKSLGAAFRPMVDVVKDTKFTKAASLYVGFWVVYVMNFTYLTIYLNDFVALPRWFSLTATNSINPLAIIILAVPLGALMARFHPMRMMTVGLSLFAFGFFLIGFSGAFWGLVVGLVIAAIGEFLTHPGFLSYVGRIAPKDRVAIYQSLGFLPIAVGYFLGSFLGGPLYETVAVVNGQPQLFWAIVTSVALLTLTGFLYLAAKVDAEDRGAARLNKKERGLTIAPFGVIIVAISVAGLLPVAGLQGGSPQPLPLTETFGTWDEHLEEDEEWTQEITVTGTGTISVLLEWEDEPNQSNAAIPLSPTQNEPDHFRLEVRLNGVLVDNVPDSDGSILIEHGLESAPVTMTISVRLDAAGDHRANGQTIVEDTGNDWTLTAGIAA